MKVMLAVIAAMLSTQAAAAVTCTEDTVLIKGDFGQARFAIEIADDTEERAKGLMFRESLPTLSGMLFVYDRVHAPSFWMRNTLIPLDMIFVEPTGRVSFIHENAIPLDETPISGGEGVIAVLEINGGLAERLGLAPGDVLAHPAFDGPDAALPCSDG